MMDIVSYPNVSVIVSCYNYEKFISSCIDSVLNQTYKDFEIIIVNDGSTDNSEEQILYYAEQYRNIKYIYQKNSGQAHAKNVGIRNALGNYIAFLDADDSWHKTKLEKQLALFSNEKVGVVYSKALYMNEEGENINFELKDKYLQPQRGNVTDHLIFNNFVPFSSSIVRKECFEAFGVFNDKYKMGIDWDLWLRISQGYEFDYVNENLLYYRIGHSNQMSKNIERRHKDTDQILSNFINDNTAKLKKSKIREAYAYTNRNRGYYYAGKNNQTAARYYLKAWKLNPFALQLYKNLLKLLIHKKRNEAI